MTPYAQSDRFVLYQGHVLSVLRELPANSIHACITSPPYWSLRAYGTEPQVWGGSDCAHEWGEHEERVWGGPQGATGQRATRTFTAHGSATSTFCRLCGAWRGELGLEPTLDLYLAHMVEIFEQVRRILHPRGVCFVNMGDSWACKPNGRSVADTKAVGRDDRAFRDKPARSPAKGASLEGRAQPGGIKGQRTIGGGIKEKDLVGQAWAVAFALRDAGWYLRDCIIWHKPGPMPSSVRDRFTTAHEYVFLLTKSRRYTFDQYAVRERTTGSTHDRGTKLSPPKEKANYLEGNGHKDWAANTPNQVQWRNRRSVWAINAPKLQLRADLPEEERSRVIAELVKRGLIR